MTSYPFFKMAAGSHFGFDAGNVRPPTKCNCRYQLGPQIWSWSDLQFCRYCDFYILPFWLEIAYSRPFLGGFGSIFPHRSNPQKDHPCTETRRLSHKAWKSVQQFDLGAGSRKKGKDKTGQDRTVKKSHNVVTFCLSGEKPHCTDWNQNLHGGSSRHLNNLRYADDIVLIATTRDHLQQLVDTVAAVSQQYGLEIGTRKTKVMTTEEGTTVLKIVCNGEVLEQVNSWWIPGCNHYLQRGL